MRVYNNWLSAYLEYTSKQESPEIFHFWAGMSTIASCLQRKCYIDRGYYTIFPNQFIVLVAESALCRKSTAARLASNMLKKTGIDIVNEKLTVGYLYRHLAGAAASAKSEDSSLTIFAPELATFLGKEAHANGLISTLTSIYDCPPETEYRTKTSGIDLIRNPCINLLGATTLDWMSTNMPGESVEGGFTSRVIFVVAEEPRCRIAWPRVTPKEIELRENLQTDLIQIAQLRGQYQVATDTEDCFEHYYKLMKEPEDMRLKSFFGRKGDHILKVAMCLCASQASDLVLKPSHIELAVKRLEEVEKKMPIAFRGVAFSKSAKDVDRILAQIEKLGGIITHAQLLKRNSCFLNAREFDEVMRTLIDSKVVSAIKDGANTIYTLIKEEKK